MHAKPTAQHRTYFQTLAMGLVVASCHVAFSAERVPADYELSVFASGFEQPVALAVAPDGRVFVGQKNGQVWVVCGAGSVPKLFTSIDVYDFSECGLLGIAFDPDFQLNGHIYFFATVSPDEQRILRYTDRDSLGTDPTVIRGGLPTSGNIHNGGGLRVGPDRKLYFSIGDTGRTELSQDMQTFAGKVCRINLDGSTPTDNPFVTPTGTPRAIFALGFRNPFRFCFAPDGRLFVMDVGSDGEGRREEINLVPRGGNGGWPLVEGAGVADIGDALIQPLVSYGDEGAAITGCVFSNDVRFPATFEGGLFHLDFVSNRLFFVRMENDALIEHVEFMQAEGGLTDLVVAPDGGLMYTEMFTGLVKRLRYAGDLPINDGSSHADQDDVPASEPGSLSGSVCGAGSMLMMLSVLSGLGLLRPRGRP